MMLTGIISGSGTAGEHGLHRAARRGQDLRETPSYRIASILDH